MTGLLRHLRARRRSQPDAGTSLIEIMVVVLILSIVLPIIAGLLQSVTDDSVSIQSRAAAEGQSQVIGEALSRQIHAATYPSGHTDDGSEFLAADGDYMEFYAALGDANGPRQITLSVAKACTTCSYYNLDESYVIPTTGPTYTGTPVTEILGTGIVLPTTWATGCAASTPASTPIFEYWDSTNTCLQTSANTTNPVNYPLTLNTSEFSAIDSVTVTLTTLDTLRPKTSPEPTDTFTLSLPNIDYAQANA